jgi:nicotinamidase-related amidase
MAGVATDYCVNEAVLAARKNGFNVKVVKDAIKAVFPDTKKEIFEKWEKE